jgi:CheY-like chemotaxis protein
MAEETRQRAQEPFFTTKGPKSTGLGLSVSGSIVKRHGGELSIQSAPGHGTTVTIRLPADRSAPATAACRPPDDTTRALSVLVLDDEDEVREVIALLLESDGHAVEQARLPEEALTRLAAGPRPDVVLTDLCMPQMTGWEVACAVKEQWPEVTVGLVTGWGDHPAPSPKAQAAVDFVIGKPVDRRTIRECLLTRRAVGSPQAF